MTEQLPADASHEQIETLELRVSAKAAESREDIKFERRVGDVIGQQSHLPQVYVRKFASARMSTCQFELRETMQHFAIQC